MDEFKIFIYYSPNKATSPKKHQLSEVSTLSLSENDFVYLEILSSELLSDEITIWLSDFRFNIILDRENTGVYYYTIDTSNLMSNVDKQKFSNTFNLEGNYRSFLKIFLNYYGVCQIETETVKNNQAHYHTIGFIEVFTEKIADINTLLEYLFEKDFFFWNIVSLTKSSASEKDRISDNIFWRLCSVSNIVNQLKTEFANNISHDKIYKLSPNYSLNAWNNEINVTEQSILWLIENSNLLEPSNSTDQDHFILLRRPYKSKLLYEEVLYPDTDIYENQVIHWFVSDIYGFLNNSKLIIGEKLEQVEGQKGALRRDIFIGYYKRLYEFILGLERDIESIKEDLQTFIPVKTASLTKIENQRFASKPHYYNAYLNLVKWVDNRQVTYNPDLLFSGLKDISKLYEIYCLFKLFDTITNELNFTPLNKDFNHKQISSFFSESFFSDKTEIIPKYEFYNDNVFLNLYYEMLPDTLTTIAQTGNRSYRPDFIIELKSKGASSFIILDAKYKRISTIENYDYAELTLKYLHGIGNKHGGFLNALGLIIINPISNTGINFYQKNQYNLYSNNATLPIIGRVEVGVENNQKNYLAVLLNEFLLL